VLPVYNESATVQEILKRVRERGKADQIVVVDDASTDGTRGILEEMESARPEGFVFLYHDENRGKGAALHTGYKAVDGDVVIVQDADLEFDPADYASLIEPIAAGRADVVYGSRYLGWPRRVHHFWHTLGNKLLTLYFNMLSNRSFTDMETCYKVCRREVLEKITLVEPRFGFDPEFTAKIAKAGFRIYETPISYSYRSYSEGKKIGVRDLMRQLYVIARYNLFS
jgi:glycosyltransferase involved in cell wall biosynthesis